MGDPYRTAAAMELARPTGLGEVISVHRVRSAATWVGAAFMVLIAPLAAYFAGPLILLGIAAAAAVWIAATLLSAPREIVLRQEGLEARPWIGATRSIAFDDCRSVFCHLAVHTTTLGTFITDGALSLENESGGRLKITERVTDAIPLFKSIERRCVRPAREDAFDAFDEGELLTFGAIAVTDRSIILRGESFGWHRVKKIQASPRRVFVHIDGELTSRSFAFAKIPFAFVLLGLIERAGTRVACIEGFVRREA